LLRYHLDKKSDRKEIEEEKHFQGGLSTKERSKRHRDRKKIFYENLEKENKKMKEEIADLKKENERLKLDLSLFKVS